MSTEKKPRKVWDNYIQLFEFPKAEKTKFVVAAATREGYRVLIIREFYLRKSDNTWMPSRDGVQIPLKSPLKNQKNADGTVPFVMPIQEFLDALPAALETLRTMPLEDSNNEVWYTPKDYNK